MSFFAVIVAAGSGQRAGPGGAKQWRTLAGKPVVRWSLEALLAAGAREVVVVVPAGDERIAAEAFADLHNWRAIPGGAATRDSVQAGIAACGAGPDEVILIHDAARPFLSPAVARAAAAAALPEAKRPLPRPARPGHAQANRRADAGQFDHFAGRPVAGPDAAGVPAQDRQRIIAKTALSALVCL